MSIKRKAKLTVNAGSIYLLASVRISKREARLVDCKSHRARGGSVQRMDASGFDAVYTDGRERTFCAGARTVSELIERFERWGVTIDNRAEVDAWDAQEGGKAKRESKLAAFARFWRIRGKRATACISFFDVVAMAA